MNPLVLLKLVPSWAYAAIIASLMFLNVTGHFREAHLKVQLAEAKTDLAKEQKTVASLIIKIETANRKAAEDTAFLVTRAANAAAEGKKREETLRLAKSDTAAELDSLRNSTMSARSAYRITGFTKSPASDAADTAYTLFDQCSAAYADLAGIADRHASDIQTLVAAWPVLPKPAERTAFPEP